METKEYQMIVIIVIAISIIVLVESYHLEIIKAAFFGYTTGTFAHWLTERMPVFKEVR